MFELNLPKADIKFINKDGKPRIWDMIRKKWLVLTPEEYVRQYFLFYLVNFLHYPASRISVERGVDVNRLSNRSDIVVYNSDNEPLILIECKAPMIKINQDTLEQASRYNLKLKARFLCVTNGLQHFFFEIDFLSQRAVEIEQIPEFSSCEL